MSEIGNATLHHSSQPDAVEVVTLLGESVVEVSHVRTGVTLASANRWRMPAAIAVLAAMLSLSAFAVGVASASRDQRARQAWRESDRPMHEFRPERMSRGWDVAAFGGLALAIGAAGIALWRRRSALQQMALSSTESDAAVAAGAIGWSLYQDPSGSTQVVLSSGVAAALVHGTARTPIEQPSVSLLQLAGGAFLELTAGPKRVLFRATTPAHTGALGPGASLDRRTLAFAGASVSAHLVLLALLQTIPPDPQTLALDASSSEARLTHVQMRANEDEIDEPTSDDGDGAAQGAAAAASPGVEGEAGTTETTDKKRAAIAKRSETPSLSREQARADAREAGFLGAFQNKSDPFSSFASTADFSSGWDDVDAQGNLNGSEIGAGAGNFGTGRRGFGPGGNGPIGGTIGTGRYTTGTCYSAHCSEMGGGGGGGPSQRRTSKVPDNVKIGDPETDGELDASIIRRYIRRKLAQIQYCYERELLAQSTLGGTVNVEFIITGKGGVVATKSKGVSPGLATCVGDVVSTIQFPVPKGGGSVKVKYPFTFRQAGS